MRRFNARSMRGRITVAVWLAGMLVATTLIARRPTANIRGVAWAESVVVIAPSDGELVRFASGLHSTVAKGHPVAHLGSELLEARHSVLLADIEALTQTQVADRQERVRRFARDRDQTRFELGELTARVKEGQATLASLEARLQVDRQLVAEGIAAEEKARETQRELQIVTARLTADRDRLATAHLSADHASARAGTAGFDDDWRIEVARRELREVEKMIEGLTLRSSIDGQITEIYRRPGEWVQAGDPLARVSATQATEVHAWLDGGIVPSAAVGEEAVIRRGSGDALRGKIAGVSSERLQLPQALWGRVDLPEWGYLVRVAVVDHAGGQVPAPGELLQVGLK